MIEARNNNDRELIIREIESLTIVGLMRRYGVSKETVRRWEEKYECHAQRAVGNKSDWRLKFRPPPELAALFPATAGVLPPYYVQGVSG